MTDDFTVTERRVDLQRVQDGYIADVVGYDFSAQTPTWVPRKGLGTYAFIVPDPDMADRVREIPDVDGTAVLHIGHHFGKHYYRSHDDRTVPVDVLEALRDRDLVLVRNVGGGWDDWGGRPEFSSSYVDFRAADVVDMDAEIADRRADTAEA